MAKKPKQPKKSMRPVVQGQQKAAEAHAKNIKKG